MSEKMLQQIIGMLGTMQTKMDSMGEKIDSLVARVSSLESEFKEFREETRANLKVLQNGQQGIRNEITDRYLLVFQDQKTY